MITIIPSIDQNEVFIYTELGNFYRITTNANYHYMDKVENSDRVHCIIPWRG